MRQIRQVVYILLYLQFFVRDVINLDVDILSEEHMSGTNDITWISDGWECESDNECTARGSTCSNHECQCAPGYIYNSDMTSCVKVATGIRDSCEDTLQCSAYLLSGAKCVGNVCVCGPGYYYLHGRCNRYVGLTEKCERSVDCYVNADFEASTCDAIKKICECSPGFYLREYRTCRRKGKVAGDECTIDIDCAFTNATCQDFVCVEKSESNDTAEHPAVLTAVTSESTEIRVGSECTSDEDCKQLGNAMCDLAGTCRCKRAHFAPNADKCIPELGESCHSDDVAGIEKSICRAGVWSCTNGTVASQDNRECRKATTGYRKKCHENEDCYIFGPDAVCQKKKCVCNENSHYVESELFCWGNKGIGETCKQDQDCYVDGFESELVCKDKICDCPDNTHLNKNKTACMDTSADIGEVCEVNEDCKTEDAICNGEVCECRENYYPQLLQHNQCVAGLNSTCEKNKDCTPKNSECVSGICSCKPNYVSAGVGSCLPILSYGEPCLQDVQCSTTVPGAICESAKKKGREITTKSPDVEAKDKKTEKEKEKVCSCGQGNHYRFGRCFKKKLLSETCTNIGECYLNSNVDKVMCMNGECACNWGYTKWNDSVCLKDSRAVRFPNGAITNVVSAGLFSIVLLLASRDIL